MELWILMSHQDEGGLSQGWGSLLGGLYSDIESACRAITDECLYKDEIVSVEYLNGGEKAAVRTKNGRVFGVYKDRVPMREHVPMKW